MIYRSRAGYLTNDTLDEMDSSCRAGIKTLFDSPEPLADYMHAEMKGFVVRGPSQRRAMNPWNFTRDQLIPFTAGLWALNSVGATEDARRVYAQHAARGFICQNFERDEIGSSKAPWFHRFINDAGQLESRSFDGPDILLPHCVWHLASCARLRWAWVIGLLGAPCLLLACVFNSRKLNSEQNQLQCMVKVAGPAFVWFYKATNKNWYKQTRNYWIGRDEHEYAFWIIRGLNGKNQN